jgi:hypothetical protein
MGVMSMITFQIEGSSGKRKRVFRACDACKKKRVRNAEINGSSLIAADQLI